MYLCIRPSSGRHHRNSMPPAMYHAMNPTDREIAEIDNTLSPYKQRFNSSASPSQQVQHRLLFFFVTLIYQLFLFQILQEFAPTCKSGCLYQGSEFNMCIFL